MTEPVHGREIELRFIDLIDMGLLEHMDFELAHYDDGDAPYATVCGISARNLSEDARREWADVLSAPVKSIKSYCSYNWIDLGMPDTEEAMERVKDFVYAYAGYCSVEDYDRWFPEVFA